MGTRVCVVLLSLLPIACVTRPDDAEVSALATQMLKTSFKERGQAKLDRLEQDETQKFCSNWFGKAIPKPLAERIEKQNLATIRWPADGKLLGEPVAHEPLGGERGAVLDVGNRLGSGDDLVLAH